MSEYAKEHFEGVLTELHAQGQEIFKEFGKATAGRDSLRADGLRDRYQAVTEIRDRLVHQSDACIALLRKLFPVFVLFWWTSK